MKLLREPAARVVMRAVLVRVLRMIAPVLGLAPASARDLARSVLADDEADETRGDDGDSAKPR